MTIKLDGKRVAAEVKANLAERVSTLKEHGIVPKTIVKSVAEIIEISAKDTIDKKGKRLSRMEKEKLIKAYTAEMKEAAKLLEFEQAAFLRDKIKKLQEELDGGSKKR